MTTSMKNWGSNLKKTGLLALVLLCFTALSGCKKQEEEVVTTGGWSEVEQDMDDELTEIFEKATEGLTGVGYKPVKLLGSQVVAGTNYRFLAEATTVTANPETSLKVVTVFVDLDGNCEILNITDYNE